MKAANVKVGSTISVMFVFGDNTSNFQYFSFKYQPVCATVNSRRLDTACTATTFAGLLAKGDEPFNGNTDGFYVGGQPVVKKITQGDNTVTVTGSVDEHGMITLAAKFKET